MFPTRALRLWIAIRVCRSSGPYAGPRSPITTAGLSVERFRAISRMLLTGTPVAVETVKRP